MLLYVANTIIYLNQYLNRYHFKHPVTDAKLSLKCSIIRICSLFLKQLLLWGKRCVAYILDKLA